MATAFTEERKSAPVMAFDDTTWDPEIKELDQAVSALLQAKRLLRLDDPQREHVLHMRNADRLLAIKRRMDALCL